MKVAIYDDLSSGKDLKRLVYLFSNYKKIDLVVDIFTCTDELFKQKQNYKIFFISFKTQNGISLAERLYHYGINAPIIITANSSDKAINAFKINAYYFLQTPIQTDLLFEVLENYFNTFVYPLIISDGFETICINCNDIIYLEANNKHCFIHLQNQTVQCNKTMARVLEVLPENRFLKISRAFAVNSNYISRFNSESVTLTNGDTLRPSRHFYKTFKCDYLRIQTPKII